MKKYTVLAAYTVDDLLLMVQEFAGNENKYYVDRCSQFTIPPNIEHDHVLSVQLYSDRSDPAGKYHKAFIVYR